MSSNYSLVTIGLPVVKTDFLSQTIISCIDQTYDFFELVILNNAKDLITKENIKRIVSEFDDKRIFYCENEVQLPAVQNWNKVLSLAKGEFFTLLSDDDILEQDFLLVLLNLAFKYPQVSLFHCRVSNVNDKNEIVNVTSNCPEFEDGIDFIYNRIIGKRQHYLSDFLCKTKDIKEIGGFADLPNGWGSDDITWFRLAIKDGVVYSSKFLFRYRLSNVSLTKATSRKLKILATMDYIRAVKEVLHKIPMIEVDSVRNIYCRVIIDKLKEFEYEKRIKYTSDYLKGYVPNDFVLKIMMFIYKAILFIHK